MFETVATFKSDDAFLQCHSRFSPSRAQRVSVVMLVLAVALITTSCGTVAQAAGTQNNQNDLKVSGHFPAGAVHQSYNAVLAVSGGSSPYYFSVKTGVLPPGISLNPATGTVSGTPTTAGNFSFEVIATDAPLLDQGSQAFAITVSGNGSGGNVKVSVSPTSATLFSNQKQQFKEKVTRGQRVRTDRRTVV